MSHEMTEIRKFISEIDEGDYVIPHFQRDFDWKPNMVKDLFISILHGYYAGTILIWSLGDKERELEMWDPLWGTTKSEKPNNAILDGQQRLSSIYYALCSPKNTFPSRNSYYYFFIDLDQTFLENEDESVLYKYYKTPQDGKTFIEEKEDWIEKGLFPICLLSNKEFLKSDDYEEWIKKYVDARNETGDFNLSAFEVTRRIESILSYDFLTEKLENKNIKEICTIFANINSKGMKLDIFDLMNAFLYPKGVKLRKDWENIQNDSLKSIDSMMKVYVLKLMSLYKQKYCSSKYLYNLIPGAEIKDRHGNKTILVKEKEEFEKLWNTSIKYSDSIRKRVMNSGKEDFGAIKNTFIPNTTLIPTFGAIKLYYDENLKDEVPEAEFNDKIKRWYWSAVLSGDYSGSSDSIMSKDYRDFIEWLQDNEKSPDRVKKISSVYLEESIDFKRVKNRNSSQYCAVLNLLAKRTAKDFFTGRILGNYPVENIHDHHIFPKGIEWDIPEDELNSILNRTLIFDDTNIIIKNKKPSKYIEEMSKIFEDSDLKEIMHSHFISDSAFECLKNDDFKGFIKERNKTIKKEIKSVLGIIDKELDKSSIIPGKKFDNEINYTSYIEDAKKFVYIIDPYFNENALRLIRKGLKNNESVKEIRIISKSNNIDKDFKDAFKNFRKQLKDEGLIVEMRIVIDSKEKRKLHDRYLITKNKCYNYVSADTASAGQLSNIVEVEDIKPIFIDLWQGSKDIFEI